MRAIYHSSLPGITALFLIAAAMAAYLGLSIAEAGRPPEDPPGTAFARPHPQVPPNIIVPGPIRNPKADAGLTYVQLTWDRPEPFVYNPPIQTQPPTLEELKARACQEAAAAAAAAPDDPDAPPPDPATACENARNAVTEAPPRNTPIPAPTILDIDYYLFEIYEADNPFPEATGQYLTPNVTPNTHKCVFIVNHDGGQNVSARIDYQERPGYLSSLCPFFPILPDREYHYRIATLSDPLDGTRYRSGWKGGFFRTAPLPLPVNLVITDVTSTSVAFNWQAPAGGDFIFVPDDAPAQVPGPHPRCPLSGAQPTSPCYTPPQYSYIYACYPVNNRSSGGAPVSTDLASPFGHCDNLQAGTDYVVSVYLSVYAYIYGFGPTSVSSDNVSFGTEGPQEQIVFTTLEYGSPMVIEELTVTPGREYLDIEWLPPPVWPNTQLVWYVLEIISASNPNGFSPDYTPPPGTIYTPPVPQCRFGIPHTAGVAHSYRADYSSQYTGSNCLFPPILPDRDYRLRLAAITEPEETLPDQHYYRGPWRDVFAKTEPLPAPSNVLISELRSTSLVVSWSPYQHDAGPTPTITYRVQCAPVNEAWGSLDTTVATTRHECTGLDPEQQYKVRVGIIFTRAGRTPGTDPTQTVFGPYAEVGVDTPTSDRPSSVGDLVASSGIDYLAVTWSAATPAPLTSIDYYIVEVVFDDAYWSPDVSNPVASPSMPTCHFIVPYNDGDPQQTYRLDWRNEYSTLCSEPPIMPDLRYKVRVAAVSRTLPRYTTVRRWRGEYSEIFVSTKPLPQPENVRTASIDRDGLTVAWNPWIPPPGPDTVVPLPPPPTPAPTLAPAQETVAYRVQCLEADQTWGTDTRVVVPAFRCEPLKPDTEYRVRVAIEFRRTQLDTSDVWTSVGPYVILDNATVDTSDAQCPAPVWEDRAVHYNPADYDGPQYTNAFPTLLDTSHVRHHDTVDVTVHWSAVRDVEWWEIQYRQESDTGYRWPIPFAQPSVTIYELPFDSPRYFMRVRGAVYTCADPLGLGDRDVRNLVDDEGRQLRISFAGEPQFAYTAWSEYWPVATNVIDPNLEQRDAGDGPTVIEGVPELAYVVAEIFGESPDQVGGWMLPLWLLVSGGMAALLTGGAAVVSGGWLRPGPMFVGAGAFTLFWCIGGPILAGIPITLALMPLALVLALIIWAVKARAAAA